MDQSHITLVVTPAELAECRGLGLRLAVVGYRTAPDGHLQRHRTLDAVAGAVMTVLADACVPDADAIAAEAAACQYAAVWLDVTPSPDAETLRDALTARGLTVYVPAELAGGAAIALHDAAVVTGSYAARVAELPERAAIWLPPLAHDFTLPSCGEGTELSPPQLADLLDACGEGAYSPELAARYLTYRAEDGGTHCILYDDAATLREKLTIAARAERAMFLPYAPVRAILPDILGV